MKLRRNNKVMAEPPSVATGDIAFNLLVFFLVCASSQPDSGRKQDIPKSDPQNQQTEQKQNIEVNLSRQRIEINGQVAPEVEFLPRMRGLLASKTRDEDRIVIVKSTKDTPYDLWIQFTGWIGDAGGIVTLQLEEEQTVVAQ